MLTSLAQNVLQFCYLHFSRNLLEPTGVIRHSKHYLVKFLALELLGPDNFIIFTTEMLHKELVTID